MGEARGAMVTASGPASRYGLGGEHQLHLRDIVQVLVLHWKVVLLVTAVVSIAAYSSAKRAVTRYRSTASFQIGSKKYGATRLDEPNVNELDIRTDPVLSEAMILQTQNLALEVVDSLGLQIHFTDARIPRASVLENAHVFNVLPRDTFTLRLRGPAGYELRDGRGALIAAAGYGAPVVDSLHGLSFTVRPSDAERTLRFVVLPAVAAANEVREGSASTSSRP